MIVKKFHRLSVAFLLAIRVGIIFGDFFYNSENEIIERVDVETLRSTLNSTLPVIETIYNSGILVFHFPGN